MKDIQFDSLTVSLCTWNSPPSYVKQKEVSHLGYYAMLYKHTHAFLKVKKKCLKDSPSHWRLKMSSFYS
jgi:hypothetical protein